jgi:hypothetical protein
VQTLKSREDMIEFLEEMMNRILQGPVDLPAANALGRLAGLLLKAIGQRTARTSAEANAGLKSLLYAKRLYLPDWRREALEKIQKEGRDKGGTVWRKIDIAT